MTFLDWVETTKKSLELLGLRRGLSFSLNELYTGLLRRSGRIWNYGTSVYEEDWDVLIVLDACRPDVLEHLSQEYIFLPETVSTYHSPGSQSLEWMNKTFLEKYDVDIDRTAYITANVFSGKLDHSRFALVDEVWQYASDTSLGTVPPEAVTDRAIQTLREQTYDRAIVHYLQPHQPYRSMQGLGPVTFDLDHTTVPDSALNRLQQGRLEFDDIWEAYADNTRWVLDSVETFLKNTDAQRVVITADHGEALGEWWCFGHPAHALLPILKTVPWVCTSASDTGAHEPSVIPGDERLDEESVEKFLAELG